MERAAFLGSYPASYIRHLAGYRVAGDPAFSLDVRRYSLPIVSHAPDSWKESRYRIGPLVRAAIMGGLREIGIGPSKVGFYLDQISDGAVEEGVSRLWAGVADRMIACLPADPESGFAQIFAHTEAEVQQLRQNGARIVLDLTDTLNHIKERHHVVCS